MTNLIISPNRKKVAIIGTGSAGIGALWALNRTHHDVYVYEAASRLGGHTNTVDFTHGKYKTAVDTGFIVLNSATYPNFINFLKCIGVPTVDTEMTFGVSRDYGKFEWAGTSLAAVFTQSRNLLSPYMWRMIFDIIRFNQYALDLLQNEEESEVHMNGNYKVNGHSVHEPQGQETIGEYLDKHGYSDAFRNDYLIPMTAAVWSTSPDKCSLEFPAVTLVRFMWNHHLLTTVGARPQWMTLKYGAKSYIDAVMQGFPPNHLFLNTTVKRVAPQPNGKVHVILQSGKTDVYDHVILATHGDTAYNLISSPTPTEDSIMSSFKTSTNTAILHNDLSLMPKRTKAWSAWNYMTLTSPPRPGYPHGGDVDQVCLTYNMNILQHIPTSVFGHVLVTLNPLHMPPKERIQGQYSYNHPLYTADAIRAQSLLPKIQNTRGISYAGAWTKYGFHEDGFSSGLKVAIDHLGAKIPFEFKDSTFSRGKKPNLGVADYLLRVWIIAIQIFILVVERIFDVRRGSAEAGYIGLEKRRLLNDVHVGKKAHFAGERKSD